MVNMRKAYIILVGKYEGKRPLEVPTHRGDGEGKDKVVPVI